MESKKNLSTEKFNANVYTHPISSIIISSMKGTAIQLSVDQSQRGKSIELDGYVCRNWEQETLAAHTSGNRRQVGNYSDKYTILTKSEVLAICNAIKLAKRWLAHLE